MSKKKLIPLEEWNDQQETSWSKEIARRMETGIPNGLACPSCGAELVDRGVMRTHPPRRAVKCPSCGYEGSRIVLLGGEIHVGCSGQ